MFTASFGGYEPCIAVIKPGVMMVDVIKAAAQVFRAHGLEQYENVATMGADKVWGIMPSNIAIMIEDMILVTPAGRENLSILAPKKAADIERTMREP